MKILTKIVFKILLLSVVLTVMNFIYEYFFYKDDLQQYSDMINLVKTIPLEADIVYVAESSNITSRPDDTDKRYISTLLAEYYPTLKLYDITKPAGHSGVYKVLLGHIPEESAIKTVIVTLNLRTFNAQWINSKMETSFQKSMVLLKKGPPLYKRFLLSFKAYDIKNNEEREQQYKAQWKKEVLKFPYSFPYKNIIEWDYYLQKKGIKDNEGNENKKQTQLAGQYIKAFAFQIDTLTNPRIKDFDDIIALAKKRGWSLIFNLMAENVELADKLVGKDLVFLMEENRQLLKKYFNNKGVLVVDNFNVVNDKMFTKEDWPTEHYNATGRRIIAKNIADSLKKYYNNYYEEVQYSDKKQTMFYNDCDHETTWGQMNTLTTERAFSGHRSSRTGNGKAYSITFEYPFQEVPDSSKNYIEISSKIFQNSMDHEALMVVEASGKDIKKFWKGFRISDQISKINIWDNYKVSLEIPDSIKNADIIKIYMYNPSDKYIYLDDFNIRFY